MITNKEYNQLLTKLDNLAKENQRLKNASKKNETNAINAAADCILIFETIYGVPNKIIEVNDTLINLLGYPKKELLSIDPLDLLAKGQKKKLLNISDQILNSGFAFVNTIFHTSQKKEVPVEMSISAMNEGNNPNIICIARNIQQRNASLKNSPTQTDRLKKITEGTNEVVFQLSLKPSLNFGYISPAASRILGFAPREIYNSSSAFFGNLHPEDKKKILTLFKSGSSRIQPIQARYLRKDEKLIWIEIYLTPEHSDTGKIVGYDGIIHDITHRHQLERMHNKKLLIENLISKVSTRFIDYKNFYRTVKETVNELGEVLQLDSITLCLCNLSITSFEYNYRSKTLGNAYVELPLAATPTLSGKLSLGDIVYLAENTSLKLQQAEKELIESTRLKALLASPLFVGDHYLGYLSFSQYRKKKLWDRVDIHLITTLTNIINQAIRKEVIIRQKDRLFKKAIELGLLTSEPHNCYPAAIFSIKSDKRINGCLNAGFFNNDGNFKRFENQKLSEVFTKENEQLISKHLDLTLKNKCMNEFTIQINSNGAKIPYLCQLTNNGDNKVLLCFYPNC